MDLENVLGMDLGMDFNIEKKLTQCYSPILFDMLKFNEILNDRKFIKRLATNLAKMLFGYLKDIKFYLKFIDECEKRYPSFNIENIRKIALLLKTLLMQFCIFLLKINIILRL